MDLQKVLIEKVAASFDEGEEVFEEENVRIKVVKGTNGLYDVYYYTFWAHDEMGIMQVLQEANIAPLLSGIWFSSEDEGVNGTQAWDLSRLLSDKQVFEHLKYLEFPLNNSKSHNCIIVTNDDDFDENGCLGHILDLMPQLEVLMVPSTPSENFFQRATHPLRELTTQTSFDHQDFIKHLASSDCFDKLEKLDFTDYSEVYV